METALVALRRRRGADATRGLFPGLLLPHPGSGWASAADLIAGDRLDTLLDLAKQRWGASPQAAAALAWRSFTYWLAMPVVLSWVTARRVPLITPADVRLWASASHRQSLVTLGLRQARMAVLPDDPFASIGTDVTIVTSEAELLGMLRQTLREDNLAPVLAALQRRVRLGTRTLLGSVASGIAYAVVRGYEASPQVLVETAESLLTALDLADLVELAVAPDPSPSPELPIRRLLPEAVPGLEPEGVVVRRRTCCLAFTLPDPKICSSCCIPTGVTRQG